MQNDHRDIAQAMDLFHFEDHSPGMAFWHPAGVRVLRALEDFSLAAHLKRGYEEVRTPSLMGAAAWQVSGHADKYSAGMFVAEGADGRDYALKPMSCPGHIAIYQDRRRSHAELPLRLFEFGAVHRNEASGAISGIMRLRAFTQDDAHVFCAEAQAVDEIVSYLDMARRAYSVFGFDNLSFKIALRPNERAGDDAVWDKAEGMLRSACREAGIAAEEVPGDGAFYGPKIEIAMEDARGRAWQCGTIQADLVLPERFDLQFAAHDGSRQRPVILHHAMLGSIERFLAIVLEGSNGHVPLWLAPVQAVVASISDKASVYAGDVREALLAAGLRIEADLSHDRIGAKIRRHAGRRVPWLAIVGEREARDGSVALRGPGFEGVVPLSCAAGRLGAPASPVV